MSTKRAIITVVMIVVLSAVLLDLRLMIDFSPTVQALIAAAASICSFAVFYLVIKYAVRNAIIEARGIGQPAENNQDDEHDEAECPECNSLHNSDYRICPYCNHTYN